MSYGHRHVYEIYLWLEINPAKNTNTKSSNSSWLLFLNIDIILRLSDSNRIDTKYSISLDCLSTSSLFSIISSGKYSRGGSSSKNTRILSIKISIFDNINNTFFYQIIIFILLEMCYYYYYNIKLDKSKQCFINYIFLKSNSNTKLVFL